MLGTSVALTTSLSRLVVMLNRHPSLKRSIRTVATGEGEAKSVVESTADLIQKIFTSCLTDRSIGRFDRPAGKKAAVYIFANLVLKLLFTVSTQTVQDSAHHADTKLQCKKSRLAVQMLTNIAASGPSLDMFPASQRVTYLYYLGRFYFDSSHFLRAAVTLQEAYQQCPPHFQSHRRQILTYLIPANMMLARFPSRLLLSRPEAQTLGPIFVPICAAIRSGNFIQYQHAMAHEFLQRKGLFLSMLYRLRTLVWRSFTRRTFRLTYIAPKDGESSRRAPTLDLEDVLITASYVQKLLEGYVPAVPAPKARPPHINTIFLKAVANNVPDTDSASSTLVPPPGGPLRLKPSQGLIWGNMAITLSGIEAIVAELVAQGLLHGFMTHQNPRFAITGTKQKGNNPVLAGWPNAYATIRDRLANEEDDLHAVPAWIKSQ
jgi:nuclear mRNA export protein PCID2/THP1